MQNKQKFLVNNDRFKSLMMDNEQAEKAFNTLKTAIDKIYQRKASTLSFEELYRNAYNLVLNKHGQLLYTGVRNSFGENLQPMIQHLQSCPDEILLRELNEVW